MTPANLPQKYLWLLLLSIALNGVFGGMLISNTKMSGHEKHLNERQFGKERRGSGIESLIRFLPEQRQREIYSNIRQEKQKSRSKLKAWRQDRRNIMELALSDPLDTVAIEAALATQRDSRNAIAMEGDRLLLLILQELTPEERKQAISELNRRNKRDGGKRQRPTPE